MIFGHIFLLILSATEFCTYRGTTKTVKCDVLIDAYVTFSPNTQFYKFAPRGILTCGKRFVKGKIISYSMFLACR